MHEKLKDSPIKPNFPRKNQVLPIESWESSQKTEEATSLKALRKKSTQLQDIPEPIEEFNNIQKSLSYYSKKNQNQNERKLKKTYTLAPIDGMEM